MTRRIDILCGKCGHKEEILQAYQYFEDDQPIAPPCPNCFYVDRKAIPSNINTPIQSSVKLKQTNIKKALEHEEHCANNHKRLVPSEVRELLAEELFDSCSCHKAPIDLIKKPAN